MRYSDRQLLNMALRTNFQSFLWRATLELNPGQPFLPNWHHKAIGYQLERVRQGEVKRLIINAPPRYLKSVTASVAFPAYLMGHDPTKRICAISYSNELSLKHSADFRTVVNARWFKAAFPAMRIKRCTDDLIETTSRGFRRSTSLSGSLTGFGGNVFIIDDPQKPLDALSPVKRANTNNWVPTTLLSRLDNKEADVIILVMQRVHLDDMTGYLLEQFGHWEQLVIPVIAEQHEIIQTGPDEFYHRLEGEPLQPERESLETLFEMRQAQGTSTFSAQYQQDPVPQDGAMIKRVWFRYYDVLPERKPRDKLIHSWDTAAKDGVQNDLSVCTVWLYQDKKYYLIDVVRGHFDYPKLKQTATALAERDQPNVVLIEDTSTGIALAQELKKTIHRKIVPVKVERDKITRLYVHEAKFEQGMVLFPKDTTFVPELEKELLAFPHGKYDDQVDSLSQALSYEGPRYTLDNVR